MEESSSSSLLDEVALVVETEEQEYKSKTVTIGNKPSVEGIPITTPTQSPTPSAKRKSKKSPSSGRRRSSLETKRTPTPQEYSPRSQKPSSRKSLSSPGSKEKKKTRRKSSKKTKTRSSVSGGGGAVDAATTTTTTTENARRESGNEDGSGAAALNGSYGSLFSRLAGSDTELFGNLQELKSVIGSRNQKGQEPYDSSNNIKPKASEEPVLVETDSEERKRISSNPTFSRVWRGGDAQQQQQYEEEGYVTKNKLQEDPFDGSTMMIMKEFVDSQDEVPSIVLDGPSVEHKQSPVMNQMELETLIAPFKDAMGVEKRKNERLQAELDSLTRQNEFLQKSLDEETRASNALRELVQKSAVSDMEWKGLRSQLDGKDIMLKQLQSAILGLKEIQIVDDSDSENSKDSESTNDDVLANTAEYFEILENTKEELNAVKMELKRTRELNEEKLKSNYETIAFFQRELIRMKQGMSDTESPKRPARRLSLFETGRRSSLGAS